MIEKTFIAVKHDGVLRGLVGEVIRRFEQKGLKIAGLKMIQADKERAAKHYRMTPDWIKKLAENTRSAYEKKCVKVNETDEQIARRVQGWLMEYFTEGPIVAIVFEGYHAIEIGRKIVGHAEARQAAPGTIRGDFTVESYQMADTFKRPIRNIVHASGNKDEAENEISVWFSKEELFDYNLPHWKVMH